MHAIQRNIIWYIVMPDLYSAEAVEDIVPAISKGCCTGWHNGITQHTGWYKPSPLEEALHPTPQGLPNGACGSQFKEPVLQWLGGVGVGRYKPHSIFSQICDHNCRLSVLEPLTHNLYDPRSTCRNFGYDRWMQIENPTVKPLLTVLSKSHLALPDDLPSTVLVDGRLLIFDLGASLYDDTPSKSNAWVFDQQNRSGWGSSGKWLVQQYLARGVEFSHMYCWERNSREHEYRRRLPPRYQSRVTWFQTAITGATGPAPSNPLVEFRANCKKKDYCVLKVDFDVPSAELNILHALLASNRTLALVDELFYEPNAFPLATTFEIYQLLRRFRELGVRAHGWP